MPGKRSLSRREAPRSTSQVLIVLQFGFCWCGGTAGVRRAASVSFRSVADLERFMIFLHREVARTLIHFLRHSISRASIRRSVSSAFGKMWITRSRYRLRNS